MKIGKARMKIKQTILFFILIISMVVLCNAQKNNGCDFSEYKSFTIVNLHFGKTVKEVTPDYPPAARYVRAQGQVIVKILIDKKGNVKKACATLGHPLLRFAATKAALNWKFKPNLGFKGSKIRYFTTYLTFNFKLD